MSPATHLLASWVIADRAALTRRNRNLVTWCGVLPDLDGLGLGVDIANALLGRPETAYYHISHPPVSVFSVRADLAFVKILRGWAGALGWRPK